MATLKSPRKSVILVWGQCSFASDKCRHEVLIMQAALFLERVSI